MADELTSSRRAVPTGPRVLGAPVRPTRSDKKPARGLSPGAVPTCRHFGSRIGEVPTTVRHGKQARGSEKIHCAI